MYENISKIKINLKNLSINRSSNYKSCVEKCVKKNFNNNYIISTIIEEHFVISFYTVFKKQT